MDVDGEPQDSQDSHLSPQPRDIVLETCTQSYLLCRSKSKAKDDIAGPTYDVSLILEAETTGDVGRAEADSRETTPPTTSRTPTLALDVPSALPSLTPTPGNESPSDTASTPRAELTTSSDLNSATDPAHTDTGITPLASPATATKELPPASPQIQTPPPPATSTSAPLQKPKPSLPLKRLHQSLDEDAFQFTPSAIVVRDGPDINAEWSVEVKRWRWA